MARSKLGRKALSVLVATTMVVSLNAPISAWAGNDDATDGATSTEQPQENAAGGGSLEASSEATPQADEGDSPTTSTGEETALVVANGKDYSTLEEAFAAAEPDESGTITYEIYGKACVNGNGTDANEWVQVLKSGLANPKQVKFEGKTSDAEICITKSNAILADQVYQIDVSYSDLKLSKENRSNPTDIAHGAEYFTTWLRDTNAADNTVAYTNCTFPNGVCNNQYGNTVLDDCTFNNSTLGYYDLWVYGGKVQVKGGIFTGPRGVKAYTEGTKPSIGLSISGASFTGLTEKAAVVVSKAANVSFDKVDVSNCTKGLIQDDLSANKATIEPNGTAISGEFGVTVNGHNFGITAGTFTGDLPASYIAPGYELNKIAEDFYSVSRIQVAQVGESKFTDLQQAVNSANDGDEITLLGDIDLADTIVVQDKAIKLNLAGHKLFNTNDIWNTGSNSWSLISVRGNGNLTIDGNGTLQAKENDCYVVDVQDGAECTLNSGTFVGNIHVVYVQEGKAIVNDGSYSVQQTYPDAGKEYEFVLNCYDANRENGTASIEVNGGTFSKFNPSNCWAEGAGTNFVASGKAVKHDASSDTYTVTDGIAQVVKSDGSAGDFFASLQDAVNAAQDGDTITLLKDTHGDGVVAKSGQFANKGLTIDFAGHKYIVGGVLVGSSGTSSNAFQLLNNNSITMKNGSIYGDAAVAGDSLTVWQGAPAIMIQNYCNLTLDRMTVVGGEETCYTLSNNNGDTVIRDSTITPGKAKSTAYKPTAFDVCRFNTYPSVSVTVEGLSTINGDVEVSGVIGSGQSRQLTIKGGAFYGAFRVANSPANITISGGSYASKVPEGYLAEGYECIPASDNRFVVAKKSNPVESGSATGSVATDGVTVNADDQQQIAESAAAAAGAVKDTSVSEGAKTANIGGITVDASDDNAGKVNEVASAAKDDNASVDVTLVVKASASGQPDQKISEKVDASRTAVVPFTLSVDMVTEVKDSSGTVTASATVPVKETAEPIKVTIAVDPATIAGKKVTVARVHDGAVEYIDPIDVDYVNGLVVFETGKFSEYAVLATDESISYSLPALDENGARASIDFNMPEGYAFAGWYKDSGLTDPYDSTASGGAAAYPKFVKVSDLVSFRGGSLRMDFTNEDGSTNYEKTSLRFGYEMHVPAGATLDREHWGWTMLNPDNNQGGFVKVKNYWMTDDNGAIANVVVTPIASDGEEFGYETEFQATAQVAYMTKDGTKVTAKDQTQVRSVKQVAEMILANTFASDEESTYAQGILAKVN